MRVTGFVLEALKSDLAPDSDRLGFMQDNIDVAACVSWISSCQNIDGGFGKEPNATLSETGYAHFAVHGLMMLGFEYFPIGYPQVKPSVDSTHDYLNQYIDVTALVDWLMSLQNPDGGWGNLPDAPSDLISTNFARKTLGKLGAKPADIAGCISFAMSCYDQDGLGGFGNQPGAPSEARPTFCGVRILRKLGGTPITGDVNSDCYVTVLDFAIMAGN